MTSVDLSSSPTDDEVIIDISSSATEIDIEQLKIMFQLARIDDTNNNKSSEIKAKSDQIKKLVCRVT